MPITVVSEVGGNTVTLVKHKDQRMTMDLPEAYALMYHLKFTLEQLAYDQVLKDRQQLIRSKYEQA